MTSHAAAAEVSDAVTELRLLLFTSIQLGCAYKEEGVVIMGPRLNFVGASAVAVVAATLTLTACGGTNEYAGEFTVANGDSTFYVGELFRHDTVTVKYTEKGGTITATISESETGNEFTTTQPDEGSGPSGGTLTMGDSGEEFTWELSGSGDGFSNDMQSGEPAMWSDTGVLDFGRGMRQETTGSEDGSVNVQIPGQVDCSCSPEG